MLYYIVTMLFLLFVWYPCMAIINNVSVQYNGGLLPDIILDLTMLLLSSSSGNITLLNAEEILYLQPMIPPNKRFDIISP